MNLDILSLWDFDDPVASRDRFHAALETADDREKAELWTQIARTHGLQREWDNAYEAIDRARAFHAKGIAEVRIELEMGRILRSSGKPVESVPHFHAAADKAKEIGQQGLYVDALHMLAIAEPEFSMKWNAEAIAFAENSDDPDAQRWLPSLYNNQGWSLFDLGKYEEALELFERAIPLREAKGKNKEWRIARWCAAKAQRMLGRHREALAEMEELYGLDPEGPFINEELALLKNDPNFAQRAIDLLKGLGWFEGEEPDRVAALQEIIVGAEM